MDGGSGRKEPTDVDPRLGGQHLRQYFRRPLHQRRRQAVDREDGDRGDDQPRRLLHPRNGRQTDRVLSNWWRDCRRFSDLRGADDQPGPPARCATLGLFLSDQRQHHQLRQLQRRGSQ